MSLFQISHRQIWQVRIGLTAACLVSPVALHAQASQQGNFEEVALKFDLRHHGNVARSNAVAAAARGLTISDEQLTVGVEVTVNRSLGRNSLKLSGHVGYDFYRRNSRLNRERIGVRAETGVNVGPCLVSLAGQFDRRQSDLDTIALVNLPGIESVRNTEMVQAYRADGRCGEVYGVRPLFGYEHTRGDNSNPLRELSDYRGNRVFAGFASDHPVVGKAKMTFERNDVGFGNRAGTPLAALTGYRVDEVRLEVSRDIGVLLTADAMAAFNWLKPDNAAAPAFNGTTWRLAGTIKPGLRLRVTASTERSLNPALGGEALYTRQASNQIGATFALSQRFTVSGGFSISKRDYAGAQANFGPLLDEDKLRRIYAGLTMRTARRLELGIDGGHEKRNATGTIYDYSGSFIGLRGRLAF